MEEGQSEILSRGSRSLRRKRLLQPPSAEVDHLMTVRETAEYLRMSESTVYHWKQKGKIPAVKLSRAVRFRKRDLEAFVLANRQGRVS